MKRTAYAAVAVLALSGALALAQMYPGSTGPMGRPTGPQTTPPTMPGQQNPQDMPSNPPAQTPASQNSSGLQGQELLQQVQQQLATDPAFKNVQADLQGKNEIVLEGTVASKAERKRAKNLVASVPGVHKVKDKLSVGASSASASNGPAVAQSSANGGGAAGSSATASSPGSQNTAGSIAGNTSASAGPAQGSVSTAGNTGTTSATSQSCPSGSCGTESVGPGASGDSAAGMQADTQRTEIQQAINSQIANANVVVNGTGNDVALSGTVTTEADRTRAEQIARQYSPNRNVVNQLNIATSSPMASPSSSSGMNSESSAAAGTGGVSGSATNPASIAANPGGSSYGQTATQGTVGAATATESNAAGQTAGQTSPSGTLPSQANPSGAAAAAGSSTDLQSAIQNALQQQNLNGVNASVSDRGIVLSGNVPTSQDHRSALRIAQSYAAGRKVVDNITVSGSSSTNPGIGTSGVGSNSSVSPGNTPPEQNNPH